tara:strand:- start:380 stop:844 length:465 start_codon:yes stop_codon:yes gene_type:complete
MSNLLVQNIKHTNGTTAQTIDTSGRTTVSVMNNDSTYRSDGGAVTQNMVQGVAKAWCHWTQVSTQTIRDSFNISGITDTGTGKTTLSINNDMSNDDWAGSMYQNGHNGTGTGDWDNNYAGGFISRATGSVAIVGYANALVDAALVDVIIVGDLA